MRSTTTTARRRTCAVKPLALRPCSRLRALTAVLPVGAPAQVRGHGGKSEETPWLHLAAGTGVLSQVESELKKVKDLNEKDNRARHFRARSAAPLVGRNLSARPWPQGARPRSSGHAAPPGTRSPPPSSSCCWRAARTSTRPMQVSASWAYSAKQLPSLPANGGGMPRPDGWTALHHVVDNRRMDVIHILIDAGADLNVQSTECERSPSSRIAQPVRDGS